MIKRDGRREEFASNKLWTSLAKACTKRPLPVGIIEKVVEEVETQLLTLSRAEIPSRVIGEIVMEKLKNLDRVAYIRFASVYRDFRDIESFKDEIEALLEPQDATSTLSNQLSFLQDDPLPTIPRRRGRRPKLPQPRPT